MTAEELHDLILEFKSQRKAFSGFMNNVADFFKPDNEALFREGFVSVHSVKLREKDIDHLKEKIQRKSSPDRVIDKSNIFREITDFCGVRVLHLRLMDFGVINDAINRHIEAQHWFLAEPPKAYTWDPEYKGYFESHHVQAELKDSFYTSVHYVVRPNAESIVSCEIQVRTLFEEIWGEIDHNLNYPLPSQNRACVEQLKVLAKLVGAGTKLVDSIYASMEVVTGPVQP